MTNKVVSFLKKAGLFLAQELPVVAAEIPALQPFLAFLPKSWQPTANAIATTATSEISLMSQQIMAAETMGNAIGSSVTGAQKASAAATGIMQIFLNSEAMAGKKISDPAKAQAAIVALSGDLADFWNAVDANVVPDVKS